MSNELEPSFSSRPMQNCMNLGNNKKVRLYVLQRLYLVENVRFSGSNKRSLFVTFSRKTNENAMHLIPNVIVFALFSFFIDLVMNRGLVKSRKLFYFIFFLV